MRGIKRKSNMGDCGSVDKVMEEAIKKKCEETSEIVVNIEFNNCTSCTFNWSWQMIVHVKYVA